MDKNANLGKFICEEIIKLSQNINCAWPISIQIEGLSLDEKAIVVNIILDLFQINLNGEIKKPIDKTFQGLAEKNFVVINNDREVGLGNLNYSSWLRGSCKINGKVICITLKDLNLIDKLEKGEISIFEFTKEFSGIEGLMVNSGNYKIKLNETNS